MFRILSGLAWPFVQTFKAGRYIYKTYWLSFLFWLADAQFNVLGYQISIGGRAHAARVGDNARVGRLFGNTLSLAPVLTTIGIVGITSFITGGAALPLWGAILLAAGVAINFGLLPICSAANTVDMQTKYDAEWELQIRNNKKAAISQEPPHGVLHGTPEQRRMLLTRSAHDANGLLGTLTSWAEGIVNLVSLFFTPIATVVSGGLFLAARSSALISATGAPFTNQYRLSVYEKNLQDQITAYYDHCRIQDRETHKKVADIINDALKSLKIAATPLREWVVFRCYCVVERLLAESTKENLIDEAQLKTNINDFINQFCDENATPEEPGDKQISEEKLRNVLGNNTPLCALDALPHLEEKLYQAIKNPALTKSNPGLGLQTCFKACKKGHPELFVTYVRSALYNKNPAFHEILMSDKDLWDSIFEKAGIADYMNFEKGQGWSFNINKLLETWPVETSHGQQLIAPYHLNQLALLLVDHICAVEVSPPDNQVIAQKKALEIWDDVINPTKDENKPEGTYDDHDPHFHGVKTFMIQCLTKELKTALDDKKPEAEVTALVQNLYQKLNSFIAGITETSVTQLIMYQLKPEAGYNYLHPEKLPENKKDKEDELSQEYYETPWLNTSSRVVKAFAAA
jgi:hypothetical protein